MIDKRVQEHWFLSPLVFVAGHMKKMVHWSSFACVRRTGDRMRKKCRIMLDVALKTVHKPRIIDIIRSKSTNDEGVSHEEDHNHVFYQQ